MPLKKAGFTTAYNGLQCFVGSHTTSYSTSTSASVLPIPRARPSGTESDYISKQPSNARSYATVKGSKSYDFRDNMNWPCHNKTTSKISSVPTPYEIFEIEKGGTYTKHKFYELVKMYHPDRHHHSDPIIAISSTERLERYRLVVQAHEILSDPVKRRAYDIHGLGWGEHSHSTIKYPRTSPTSEHWGTDSPFANATWEDWERWYTRKTTPPNAAGPQTYAGTYINSNMFASFVILLAIISGIAQATHAASQGGSIEERAQAFTAKTHQFMSDRKVANATYSGPETGMHGFGSKEADDRIRHFLERRDPHRYGLKEEEEEAYRNHFARQVLPEPKRMKKNECLSK